MFVEIPEFRRCCFCLPLRRGILLFGYLSLVLTCLFTILQIVICAFFSDTTFATTTALYRGVVMEAQICAIFVLYTLDIVFNIVLIVGAHMKRHRLMRVYYYYQLTTMIASFFMVLITYSDIDRVGSWAIALTQFSIAFTGFVLQIYLLLLIRSELSKDRYTEGRSGFVNHAAEVFVEPPLRRQWRTVL